MAPKSIPEEWTAGIEYPDAHTCVLYLEMPARGVVLLQAHFELYEGLGIVRTLEARTLEGGNQLVCVLTAPDQLNDCLGALQDLKRTIVWKVHACPPDTPEGRTMRERYLGYFSHATHSS